MLVCPPCFQACTWWISEPNAPCLQPGNAQTGETMQAISRCFWLAKRSVSYRLTAPCSGWKAAALKGGDIPVASEKEPSAPHDTSTDIQLEPMTPTAEAEKSQYNQTEQEGTANLN